MVLCLCRSRADGRHFGTLDRMLCEDRTAGIRDYGRLCNCILASKCHSLTTPFTAEGSVLNSVLLTASVQSAVYAWLYQRAYAIIRMDHVYGHFCGVLRSLLHPGRNSQPLQKSVYQARYKAKTNKERPAK